ncbi:MAG TPA: DUF305 domain-containing protein [Bryobacteraceae bacterium]|nr:DUF305 domain-containing protein [Bryobacteraceae bacterium]
MNRRVLFSLLTLAVAAVLPCPAQSDRDGSFDHKFLSKVTQHYQGAIKIGELYQQKKATRSELKTFCSKIGIDQRSEKPQMEQWRAQGYRGEEMRVPEIPLRCNRNRRTEWPSSAAKTGDALDHRFRIAITEYRREEILDMKACVTQVEQGDLKALCPKLTGEQQKEMAQMEQRRREWFQDHGPGPRDPPREKAD